MRMLIHSGIPSLPRLLKILQCFRIYVRDTKILVLEEELKTIEPIVDIIPIVRVLVAQLTVALFVLFVQFSHLLTLILIDLLRKFAEFVWRNLLVVRNGGTIFVLAQKTGQQFCTLLQSVESDLCLHTVLADIEKFLNSKEVSTLDNFFDLGDLALLLVLADFFCRLVCDVGHKVALHQLLYYVVC
uniref:Uncharacterized protein n=1 Tax=Podoviridae sp. ctsNK10 TaxID=2826582 RepID=A0A8S5NL02_9CAUD|nr:MAG TPA: hypothetical protein [Podoviridae sp. ctsNK10]